MADKSEPDANNVILGMLIEDISRSRLEACFFSL